MESNMENLFQYTPAQFNMVHHFLLFGASAMAVGFVYFITTRSNVSQNYRPSSTLSCVVMVSAFMLLLFQAIGWQNAFVYNGSAYVQGTSTFSNGYRYINWSIDVPVLLTQLLVVLGIKGKQLRANWAKFTVGGLAMIWLGYVGQFYETTNMTQMYIWGAISTVFMVYLLYLVGMLIFPNARNLPGRSANIMRGLFWLILFSWTLYPLAYQLPDWIPTANGMVLRQGMFTVADVTSKVVYGILLSHAAQIRSRHEGYQPAQLTPVV